MYLVRSMAGTWSLLGPDYRPVKVEAVAIDTLYPHRILEDEPYLMEVEGQLAWYHLEGLGPPPEHWILFLGGLAKLSPDTDRRGPA